MASVDHVNTLLYIVSLEESTRPGRSPVRGRTGRGRRAPNALGHRRLCCPAALPLATCYCPTTHPNNPLFIFPLKPLDACFSFARQQQHPVGGRRGEGGREGYQLHHHTVVVLVSPSTPCNHAHHTLRQCAGTTKASHMALLQGGFPNSLLLPRRFRPSRARWLRQTCPSASSNTTSFLKLSTVRTTTMRNFCTYYCNKTQQKQSDNNTNIVNKTRWCHHSGHPPPSLGPDAA